MQEKDLYPAIEKLQILYESAILSVYVHYNPYRSLYAIQLYHSRPHSYIQLKKVIIMSNVFGFNKKTASAVYSVMDGGEEGTRTLTMFPSPDFKSDASTDSATSPDMEVRAGVEPALTELQSVALPLG